MNCAIHNEVPATVYCRTCGKALCDQCKRDVRGVIYCEDCLASRVQGTLPPPAPVVAPAVPQAPALPSGGGPSPMAAFFLGFIPGVGAIYNGQVAKGLIHVVIIAGLIWAEDRSGGGPFFGLLIFFFWCYMVWDAYTTAKAIQEHRPLPDPFGLGASLPSLDTSAPTHSGPGSETVKHTTHLPTAAIVLIGLGVLFLLDNIGIFRWHWFGHLWPVILIALGVGLWLKRSGRMA